MAESQPSTLTDTRVCHLDADSPEEFLQSHDCVLLSIFHPLLPRCKRFFPVFEQIAEELYEAGSPITCAQIDCVGKPGILRKFGVTSYATVFLCRGYDSFKPYHGPLREKDILAFLQRQSMPTVGDIDSASLHRLRSMNNTLVVAFVPEDDREIREDFAAVAEDMRDDYVFGITGDDALAEIEEAKMPSIVVYKALPETKSLLEGSLNERAIRDFVKFATRPLVAEFLPELQEGFQNGSIPLGYLFVSPDSQNQVKTENLLPLARRHHSRIQLGIVDVGLFPELSKSMHLENQTWPAFAIHEPVKNLKFPLPARLTSPAGPKAADIEPHVEAFLAGSLKPTIKSQPVPSAETPVTEVVGLSYDSVVLDDSKDVLVEFYTQWCGPCKTLRPEYEKLGQLVAADEEARKLVTIARMDPETNDAPDKDIRGFPWFKLYPSGRKAAPLTFNGERRVAGWVKFIRENGTHGVELRVGN